MKNIFLIILSLFLVTSCEKEIDLDLEDQSGQIVIEGNITDQAGPYFVKITKSVAFTQANQYPAVTNAQVILSDNTGQTETSVCRKRKLQNVHLCGTARKNLYVNH